MADKLRTLLDISLMLLDELATRISSFLARLVGADSLPVFVGWIAIPLAVLVLFWIVHVFMKPR